MKTIIVTSGSLTGGVYSVTKSLVIGRDSDCDIQVMDPSASRRHATVTDHGGHTLLLCDLLSQNGTFVDDERISEKVLESGDSFSIGHVEFDYLEVADSQVQSSRGQAINLVSVPPPVDEEERLSIEERERLKARASAVTIPPSQFPE